jgi:CubicO group peptidase (beta-lactamase class C family)
MSHDFAFPRTVIQEAIARRAFPAAAVEVGTSGAVLWREAFGRLTYDEDATETTVETIFDLASLTKVIATTTLAMESVAHRALDLDRPVTKWITNWVGPDRDMVTPRDLLAHTSGLTAWLPFFRDYEGRREFERAICALPLEYRPRTQSVYSDLGFMLLGFILEDAAGRSLADQFADWCARAIPDAGPLQFAPPSSWRSRTAPTEVDAWRGRLLVAEVHDENAWALAGVAGHAGLFGTVGAAGVFARGMLGTVTGEGVGLVDRGIARAFVRRARVPGGSRALGWDTMLPTSSCGTRMSPSSFGHTGFTGTSIWIDPGSNVYVVLLTNRVHPTRENDAIREVRRAFHDAVMEGVRVK